MAVPASPLKPTWSIRPTVSVTECPICQGRKFRPLVELVDSGIPIRYVICCHCGLALLTPRVSDADLEHFYRSEFPLTSGRWPPSGRNQHRRDPRAERLAEFALRRISGRIHSHLDVGACSGELLLAVRSRVPVDRLVGVELFEPFRELCTQHGLRACASIRDLDGERFDLITLSHVLEHVADPVALLRAVRGLLDDDGHLLVETPDLFGLARYGLVHPVCFCRKTLWDALQAAGYQVVASDSKTLRITVLAKAGPRRAARKTWWRLVAIRERWEPAVRRWSFRARRRLGAL